jgi:uncharacterized protein (TIGR02246 family)
MSATTSIDSPAGASEAFVAAINAHDLQGALALYRDDAVLMAPDGQCAQGAEAIRALLEGLLAMRPEMETRIERVIEVGDLAIASETWTMRIRSAEGMINEHGGQSIVLFTRDEDTGWRLLIDAPWGLIAPPSPGRVS